MNLTKFVHLAECYSDTVIRNLDYLARSTTTIYEFTKF